MLLIICMGTLAIARINFTGHLFYIGLSIELNGTTYANNSEVSITEVGEGHNALLCRADSDSVEPQQHWRYPNYTMVENSTSSNDIYTTRENMTVSLNRRDGVTQPTGHYCCEVATMTDTDRMCIFLHNHGIECGEGIWANVSPYTHPYT